MVRITRTCSLLAGTLALLTPVGAAAHDGDARTLAAYARARVADADGDVTRAARDYAAALAARPHDEVIAIRAYRKALAVGDLALADRSTAILDRSGVAPADSDLLVLAGALAEGEMAEAEEAIDRLSRSQFDFLVPVLRAWLLRPRGVDPIAFLDEQPANPIGTRYVRSHRALLLLASGRVGDALPAVRTVLEADAANLDFRLAAARLLAEQGRGETAGALLTGMDRRPNRSGTAGISAREGVALLFTQLAVDIGLEQGGTLGIVLTRSALRLTPGSTRARILLSQALAAEGASAVALSELGGIPAADPLAASARATAADIRSDDGHPEAALALAAERAGGKEASPDALVDYGDLLVTAKRYAEAAEQYARAADRLRDDRQGVPWTLLFQEGAARERAGDWDAAKPLLEAALAAAPDEPLVLNHLGYSQVERGENLAAAEARLLKASELRPQDAAITDSLGVAYYKRGQHQKAVTTLERAAQSSPEDAEINEHLGDAYWAVGRRYEARYAWRAAQVHASAEDSRRIAAKIADGPRTATR